MTIKVDAHEAGPSAMMRRGDRDRERGGRGDRPDRGDRDRGDRGGDRDRAPRRPREDFDA
jgi:small subunit ribosomal protein S6